MAHLIIQYSENLDSQVKMTDVCKVMSGVMQKTGFFPLAGIRVRAYPVTHRSIADEHPENTFLDMVLRMGEGRTEQQKSRVGTDLMAAAEAEFSTQLANPHFALSLEIIVISKLLSWKKNSIHNRLRPN
jgi:5-carboxymethyl-2-hydroxymuconate isomerase